MVPFAGSCVDCPKRTGHNKLLFADVSRQDACSDPNCYAAKVSAHIAKAIAAKPKLVQVSTAYGQQQEGSSVLPRNRYTEIRTEKPKTKEEAARPEFKTCKYTTEAIVSEGIDKGELRKVCTEPTCPVHHPKPRSQRVADDPKAKAQEERQRREDVYKRQLLALSFAGVVHAQGTMDFSGAQTLMGTFKTFAIYAGAVICFGGLIFAGIRMLSGRFQDAIPGLFGALFGAGILGWGAGWIGSLTGQAMQ